MLNKPAAGGLATVLLLALCLLHPASGHADGINLNRFTPAETGLTAAAACAAAACAAACAACAAACAFCICACSALFLCCSRNG